MMIRFAIGMIAVGLVMMLAGCGSGTDRAPEPVRSSPAETTSPIPPVKNPRDVAALARRPCELLTSQQAAGFGLDLPPKQYDAALGDLGCKWTSTTRDRRTFRTVYISTFTNNPTLEVIYHREYGRPFFELTELTGYPTIVTRSNPDLPHCNIDVKPAEFQSVSVSYDSDTFNNDPQQACVVGKQIAVAVLMNLPPKS
ncbi:MAG TPA: DUF3558 domain-containing protein [Pseudonocardiaceae bacterium]|nr:DUF3558 domain-containing protein [Pseudonocardiaceae bacterium]